MDSGKLLKYFSVEAPNMIGLGNIIEVVVVTASFLFIEVDGRAGEPVAIVQ